MATKETSKSKIDPPKENSKAQREQKARNEESFQLRRRVQREKDLQMNEASAPDPDLTPTSCALFKAFLLGRCRRTCSLPAQHLTITTHLSNPRTTSSNG